MADSGNSFLNNVRIVLKSTLVARGGRTTIELLEKDYLGSEYEAIPFRKLGFTSTEALLRSLSDVMSVQGHGRSAVVCLLESGSSKTKHLQEMIKAQKPDRKFKEKFQRSAGRGYNGQRNRQSFVNPRAPQYPVAVASMAPRFPYQVHHAMIPTTVLLNMTNPYVFQQQPQPFNSSAWVDGRRVSVTPSNRFPAPPTPPEQRPVRQKTPPPPLQRPSPVKTVPSPIKRIISSAKMRPPTPTTASSPAQVRKIPSPIKRILSPATMRTPSPDKVGEFGKLDWTSCPPPGFRDPPQEPSSNRSLEKTADDSRMDEIEAQIGDLTCTSAQLPSRTNSPPDLYAFSDASTPDEPAFPDWVYEKCQLVPKDMAGYREEFQLNKRRDILKIGGWTQIYITDVHSPHKFFFQTEVEQADIEKVMTNLRIMYGKQSNDKLKPRQHEVRRNMLVAALYDEVWHRGRVVSDPFLHNKVLTVKVHYVDFGTVDNVRLDNIRFLHKDFLETPLLCHRASLSGIMPRGNSWKPKVTKFFLAHVSDRGVMAYGQAFHAPDRSWHIEVVDPAKKPAVNITMLLITEDLAQDCESDDLTEYMMYYKSHPPTFDELENGQYPTFSELLEYARKGIEYEAEEETACDDEIGAAEGEGAEQEMVIMYLNETNPFIECLRERNIRVITIPRRDVSPSEVNDLSHSDRKDPPLDNINIPIEKEIHSKNPFLLRLSDD